MWLRTLAMSSASLVVAGIALAADPATPQRNEVVMDFGSSECTASVADGKTRWDSPAQTLDQKFAQAPDVYFSISGHSMVAMARDGSLSIALVTSGEVSQQGSQQQGPTNRRSSIG